MKKALVVASVLGAISISGCAIDPYTGEQKVSNTAIGAAAGAVVGAAVSSKKDRAKGAAIGAALGGGAGYYFDYQEKILREKLQGTGVSVTRLENGGIQLNMPGNVSFPTNQYQLLPSFYDTLDSVAIVLKEYSKTAIQVTGHTDSTGSFEHNQQLSERRAESVKSYLASQGVASSRLHSNGYGPRYPVASNATPEGRAANRRVEIQILNQN
ncbi:OmpA family protein [Ketobacter sp.]|uniref:OmpA family protein n=1 Tax=Ketobacter sp. TaxID=2083498 RepID=UPI000F186D30|nr:OmpA family protein [Ketobacter sp.]RLT97439.1 MAG: glycine zipper 2TM domain-containing protein [Ketobacter sp.]